MINLKNIKRTREKDNRDFKIGIRADRNEKVEDWSHTIFNKIFKKIKRHEFTSYYNTNELYQLEKKIAQYLKISKDNFVINHGGDGVIKEFLILNNKKNLKVLINANNYGMYKIYFKALNIKYFEVPYLVDINTKNLINLNFNYFNKNIKKSNIVFLTYPNVASNFDFKITDIDYLCKKFSKKLFFIDESYYGFGHPSCISIAKKNKNLFVLRSITKTFGLASARVGFLVSHKDSIKPFKTIETPYPLSLFSGKCLSFFLKNREIVNKYNARVEVGRNFFCKEMKKKKYLINNGGGLSVLVFFENFKKLKITYNRLLKNKIYTKLVKINNHNFIRLTCAPKKIMKKILRDF